LQKYEEHNRIQYFADILILIGFVIIGGLAMGTIGLLACAGIFKINISQMLNQIQGGVNDTNIGIFKIYNFFVSFGMWVLSAFILLKIRNYKPKYFWQINKPTYAKTWLVLPIIFICTIVLSAFLLQINQAIHFPYFLKSWIENTKDTQKMMGTFLTMHTPSQLLVNLLLVAAAPALFEEIFFRATLQKLIIGASGNMHIGIAITSFLFAAIHMNAMQIIPMFFIALILGYLYQFTQSIWPSVFLHFLNNALAVLGTYYQNKHSLAKQITEDTMDIPIFSICIAALVLNIIFIYLYQHYRKTKFIND